MKRTLSIAMIMAFSSLVTHAHIISGSVLTNSVGLEGATVSFKTTPNSLPAYQVTTAADGTYASPDLPTGTYYVCASKTGYMISSNTEVALGEADEPGNNFTLTVGRSIPKMEYLLFAADADDLTTVGSNADWPMLYNTFPFESLTTLQQMATPTVVTYHGRKMSELFRNNADGYRLNRTSLAQGQNIPVDGLTVTVLVRPYYLDASINWCSLVDMFYSDFRVDLQAHTGLVRVYRKGNTQDVAIIPDGQLTILSLVLNTNGTYKVWFTPFDPETGAFGATTLKKEYTEAGAFTELTPRRDGTQDYKGFINVGRNNPDGWTAINAYVGDVFVYKTALNDADRTILEADFVNETMRTLYKVTSTTSGTGMAELTYADANPGNRVDWFDASGVTFHTPIVRWDTVLADVRTNGTPMASHPTFPWTLALSENMTVEFVYNLAPSRTVTGTVYDMANNPVTNAIVKLRPVTKGFPLEAYSVTTDSSGQYSLSFPNGPCYLLATKDGYIPSAEQAVTVDDGQSVRNFYITAGRNIPKMDYLLFGSLASDLSNDENGFANNWPLVYNTYPFENRTELWRRNSPTVVEYVGANFVSNKYSTGDSFVLNTRWQEPLAGEIPTEGLTISTVVRPKRLGFDVPWTSVVNIFFNQWSLAIRSDNGNVQVVRNGSFLDHNNVPDDQLTLLTLVAQSNGTYKVWTRKIDGASTPKISSLAGERTDTAPFNSLTPGNKGWDGNGYIEIGRNWPDGWSVFNGLIGDVFVYKVALSDAEREQLEDDMVTTILEATPHWHVVSSVSGDTGGTIEPLGDTIVPVDEAIHFTITPDTGKYLSDILTNGVTIGGANVPTTGSWSFTPAMDTTVEFAFINTPADWPIQGRVTDSVTGLAISNATVSVLTNKYALPVSAVVTDANGDYILEGTYSGVVSVVVSATGYMIQHGIVNFPGYGNFTLVPTGRNIPKMEYLFYGFSTDALGEVGSSADWKMMYTTHPGYADQWNATAAKQNTPSVAMYRGVKFNTLRGLSANDGFRLPDISSPIPLTNGATIVSLVRRQADGGGDHGWTSIVSFFHTVFGWGTGNFSGQVRAWCYGNMENSGYQVPDGQVILVSIVYQANGNYQIWKRVRNPGDAVFSAPTVEYYTNTGTADMTSLRPGGGGHEKALFLGRGWDGWQAFKGGLGDTFVYKTALTDEERLTLEDDIVAKYDGVTTYKVTSSATAGGVPTISVGGMTFGMGEEYFAAGDLTYTFNCAWDKIVGEVKVNGVAMDPTPEGTTWTLAINAATTVEITYVDKPGATVSGQVTDANTGFPLANASVYFKPGTTAPATYQYQVVATTDTNGLYSALLPGGSYLLAASAAGYVVAPDTNLTVVPDVPAGQDFGLNKSGKFVPQMNKLLFAAYADGIRPSDKHWELLYPYGFVSAPMGEIDLVTDVGQWYFNNNDPRYNGYNVMQLLSPEPCNGFTAVAMFKPIAHPGGDNNWQSVIDMCYSRFCLIVNRNNLRLRIRSNDRWTDSVYLEDGVKYVLSVVTQPTGEYKVYTNGVEVLDVTTTSDWTMIRPGQNTSQIGAFDSWITIGRNAPDAWSTCNGNIAAALVWKDVLTSTERETLEQDLLAKYRDGTFSVKALVAGEGREPGAGAVTPVSSIVSSGGSVSYTITCDKRKQLKSIRVNGALIPDMEGVTAYTLENVTQDTTVEFLFKDSPPGLMISIF